MDFFNKFKGKFKGPDASSGPAGQQPAASTTSRMSYTPKRHSLNTDYEISKKVLGLGINGKVLECYDKKSKEKFALKVRYTSSIFKFYLSINYILQLQGYMYIFM